MSDDAHTLIAARLRGAGQSYTAGRRELVESLVRAGRPTTMAELLSLSPGLAQSSAYRNLVDLESIGVVRRVPGCGDLSRYELSEDIIGHHHHMICTVCGAVEDFRLPTAAENRLETGLVDALGRAGFRADAHRVDVFGTCAGCDLAADAAV